MSEMTAAQAAALASAGRNILTEAVLVDTDFPLYAAGMRWSELLEEDASTGFSGSEPSEAGHPGILALDPSTNNVGIWSKSALTCVRFGGGIWTHTSIFKTPAALSDPTNRYMLIGGYADAMESAGGANVTDGACWRYRDDVNGGRFYLMGQSNGSYSGVIDTGVTVVANTWYTIVSTMNAAANSFNVVINGVTGANPLTTNIPTGSGRNTGIVALQNKRLAGTGPVAYLDACRVTCTFSASR